MSKYTFVLSDESLNSYGFVVLTKGIDLERFTKNPVMFYQHNRESGIIGRWESIRIENNRLLADAVFDESEPLAKRIKEKIDNNFLRAASISIEPVRQEEINRVQSVTNCTLLEASIVDTPSNQNAVKLRKKNGEFVFNLSDLEDTTDNFRKRLLKLLELEETATDDNILSKIEALINIESIENEINNSVKLGIVNNDEKQMLLQLAKNNKKEVINLLKAKKVTDKNLIDKELKNGMLSQKFIYTDREIFEFIGNELGLDFLKKLIKAIPDNIANQKDMLADTLSGWGLVKQSQGVNLYTENKNKQFNLDWYRKNDPEYLKNNPDFYKQLLKE